MKAMGVALAVIGVIWLAVAFMLPTSVSTATQATFNLDLAHQRSSHMLGAGITILAGVMLIGFGSLGEQMQGLREVATHGAGSSASPPPVFTEADMAGRSEDELTNLLIEAAIANDRQSALRLAERGADPRKQGTGSYAGGSALDYAKGHGHIALMRALRDLPPKASA